MIKGGRGKVKSILIYGTVFVLIPALIVIGIVLFDDRRYLLVSILVAVLSLVPVFLRFEKKNTAVRELVMIAVMTSVSIVGRLIFAPLPGFKPVTAIVILTAMYFGPEAGFLTGALSALVSNFYFGQGPWTPFQMVVWGLIGFVAGLLNARGWLKKWWMLCLIGIVGGVAFSLMMDIWTVLSIDGYLNWARYAVVVAASVPFIAIYAASNIVFLLVLKKPLGAVLQRVKTKYGVFSAYRPEPKNERKLRHAQTDLPDTEKEGADQDCN